VETPTNPTLRIVDLHKAIAFAKRHKLISIIDNTFATPVLQNPLAMGYDIVVHSATKALAGHSDVIAGVAVGNKHWMERIRHMIIYLGGSMDPEAAYLLIRGMKTGRARRTAVRKRHGGCEIPGKTSQGRACSLSRIGIAPGSQTGEKADARIWNHDGV
jgi:cystathionine beta-lyase/cystathionine gamma-synthase